MSTPVDNSQILVAIAQLQTEVSNLKDAVGKMTTPVVLPSTPNTLPNTGGIAGLLAAAYMVYVQATGKG